MIVPALILPGNNFDKPKMSFSRYLSRRNREQLGIKLPFSASCLTPAIPVSGEEERKRIADSKEVELTIVSGLRNNRKLELELRAARLHALAKPRLDSDFITVSRFFRGRFCVEPSSELLSTIIILKSISDCG